MKLYKLTFARNDMLLLKEVTEAHGLNGLYHYEHNNGNLIYAIVRAGSEYEALAFVDVILDEITEKAPVDIQNSEFKNQNARKVA